ncbi:FAS1 domain containing protein [Hyaloscypha variabilis]|uniref:FAS1 domain-containing protein n=1 Tax=Hyaloscypha variabilis (strain UAMH 11265 / GT02V1 / F) TaxID=1149755 RepID=A0A2J6RA73_HYAVF|nr:FAS1 domain-containing protein [Hyaloscypha variabilis F]
MRSCSWRSLLATSLGLFAARTNAQTGTLLDLGDLLAGQKNLTTFNALIQKYPEILLQLPSTQGVTILAPNNDAFNKIPYSSLNSAFKDNNQDVITNVLEYHILQGTRLAASLVPGNPTFIPTFLTSPEWSNVTGGQNVENVRQAGNVVVFVSGQGSRSTLTQADLSFTGGVVQVIDSLLIPPSNITDTTTAFNLTSFQGALYAGDRLPIDSTTPSVTFFAPWNAAFQALGPAISTMTSDEIGQIMDYHMLPQVVYSTGLTNGTKFITAQGENLTVLHSGNNIYINSAQLLQTDILIANGVIHMIDNVLNPQGPGAQPNPTIATQAPVFAGATSVTNLPFTSDIPCTSSCSVSTHSSSSTAVNAKTTPTTTSVYTSKSKGVGVAVARETGLHAAGLMVALGGAVMLL